MSLESTLIGQQDIGVEDQAMLPDVPSCVGGGLGTDYTRPWRIMPA